MQIHRIGGWKLLVGAMLAAAGLGFGGYMYLGPYQKLNKLLSARNTELGEERVAGQYLVAERDKLQGEVAKHEGTDRDRAASQARKQQVVNTFSGEMKTPLEAFAGTIATGDGRASIAFPTTSLFEQPTSTVITPQGEAALKILAVSLKKLGFRTRVLARLIPSPPPRELAQFKTVGEFAMLRSVRVALALAAGGVPADRVSAAGAGPATAAHKGKPAVPDRLEIEIEPE